jgi:hypothetical protein
MKVFCPTHRISFEVPESGRILCGSGGHALALNFPHEDFWGYCCDCRHFWPSEMGKGGKAEEACPVCERATARRYLCDECELVSIESDNPTGRKSRRITMRGSVEFTCPGCHLPAKSELHEHACEVAAAVFSTARASCPFCERPINQAEYVTPPGNLICNACGTRAAPNDSFCKNCGNPVGITEPQTPIAAQTAEAAGFILPTLLTLVLSLVPVRTLMIAIGAVMGAALILSVSSLIAPTPQAFNPHPSFGDPPQAEPAPMNVQEAINKEVEDLKPGRILFNPSLEMQVGKTEIVEVRISKSLSEELSKGLKGAGTPQIENIKVGSYMGVVLNGTKDFFFIDMKNREQKLITEGEYTEWLFEVTPLKQGNPSLFLTAYNVISTPSGDRSYEHPALIKEIKVSTTIGYTVGSFLKDNWKEITGIVIASGIVGLIANWIKRRKERRRQPPPWERPL